MMAVTCKATMISLVSCGSCRSDDKRCGEGVTTPGIQFWPCRTSDDRSRLRCLRGGRSRRAAAVVRPVDRPVDEHRLVERGQRADRDYRVQQADRGQLA